MAAHVYRNDEGDTALEVEERTRVLRWARDARYNARKTAQNCYGARMLASQAGQLCISSAVSCLSSSGFGICSPGVTGCADMRRCDSQRARGRALPPMEQARQLSNSPHAHLLRRETAPFPDCCAFLHCVAYVPSVHARVFAVSMTTEEIEGVEALKFDRGYQRRLRRSNEIGDYDSSTRQFLARDGAFRRWLAEGATAECTWEAFPHCLRVGSK